MDIATDKVCELILRAREVDVKEDATDPDSGSNPSDDGSIDVLTSAPGDATEDQIRDFIDGLNEDERHDLVAIAWIGRGDFEASEWREALRMAQERESLSTADYLLGIPNLGDLLDEGLAALGRSCS
ncbi:DUF3775 domain-containing protein [Enterovirga sp.]|uniref:DUF3775 domain-containing protein n=1 Tax=Enterovirga sp. TaxID=2026350 RepID=UPI002BEE66E3|nr:DUF3775 domain-containing protein [Enterovirga sp.]HMO30808.1 DUF3775 domain-containing protein [Enterovirga sp.]